MIARIALLACRSNLTDIVLAEATTTHQSREMAALPCFSKRVLNIFGEREYGMMLRMIGEG